MSDSDEARHEEAAVVRAIDGAPTNESGCCRSGQQMARIAWAIMTRGERYKEPELLLSHETADRHHQLARA